MNDDGRSDESPIDEEESVRTVRVPIRRGAGPFDPVEYAEVESDAAGHWSLDVWHAEPPR